MERIVIRSSNWLGDAVMTVPAVRAIKRSLGAHVAVLTPEKIADVWRLVPEVDEVIAFPAAMGRGLLRALAGIMHVFKVAKLIRGRGLTTGVVLPNSLRTGLEMWLARIPRRVGYSGHGRRSVLLTEVLREDADEAPAGPPEHQVHHYLRLAEFLGAVVPQDPLFGFPDASEGKPRDPGAPLQIAVCAGAEYGPAKRWPPERYAEVIREMSKTAPFRWRLVGTSKDRPVALLGVRTVSIFGSTEPTLTGPLGAGHTVVRRHVECSPCFLRDCPIDFRCMRDIESGAVVAALTAALGVPAAR
jgi:ADP-heptose:LPS heptosyltransferase